MAKRRIYGPISKAIKGLCVRLLLMNGSDDDFKEGIRILLNKYSYLDELTYYSIALSLRKWTIDCGTKDTERIWHLTDQVNPKIREAWNNYEREFLNGN